MARVFVERSGEVYGPYGEVEVRSLIESNRLFLNDIAWIESIPETMTLAQAMDRCGWELPHSSNPMDTIQKRGLEFILPLKGFLTFDWLREPRFLLLTVIGLIPLALLFVGESRDFIYIGIASYFSLLWGMFFYYFFKTEQVKLKECCRCFLVTALFSIAALQLLHKIGIFNFAAPLTVRDFFPFRCLGWMILAGVPEEICKAAVIFWLARRKGALFTPQTIVLYGLFSGLGFGIKEGISYQMNINSEYGVDGAYVLNVLRLTSLPFLHATWCAISSYFIASSVLMPMQRKFLLVLAVLVPATIHACYNACNSIMKLVPAILGVILFCLYLNKATEVSKNLGALDQTV